MPDAIKTGSLQQIDGDDVITLHPEATAAQVKTADGSDMATEMGILKSGIIQVVESIPSEAPDGLYFVTGDGS